MQGLGAAIISPAALSIVMTTFEEGAERNKALGIWGAIGGAGAAVGVLAGGVLTKYLGWEWIFFVNVPVGVHRVRCSPRASCAKAALDRDSTGHRRRGHGHRRPRAARLRGLEGAGPRLGLGWTLSRLAVAVVLLVAFLVIESRAKYPLMPFSIFRVRTVAGANVAGAPARRASTFSNFFVLTLYVQQVLGYSALKTGVTFVATAGSAVLFAGLAQSLVTKIGAKPVMAVGFVAMIAGMLWYAQIPVHASFWSDLLPGYLLVGFALPFTFIPVSIAALAGVAAARGRPCLGADQHRAADRRRDRRRRRVVGLAQPLQPRAQGRASVPGGVHERLAMGVLGDGRGRRRRPDRHADARPARRARSRRPERARGGRQPRRAHSFRAWRASIRASSTWSGRRRSSGSTGSRGTSRARSWRSSSS